MDIAILKNIHPNEVEKIANGKKTILVSKTTPKLEPPFIVYMYCTKDTPLYMHNKRIRSTCGITDWEECSAEQCNSKVVAEFTCEKIERYDSNELGWYYYDLETYLLRDEIVGRCEGKPLYYWHISDLKIYDEPMELSEFYKFGAKELDDMRTTDDIEELCRYCYRTDYGKHASCVTPNGIEFCEGRYCDEAYKVYKDKNFRVTRPPIGWCYVEEV